MSRIYYFTTAQEESLFKSSIDKWMVPPNLSNQNFHNKLVRCLAINNDVEVISIRPINKNYSDAVLEEKVIKKGNLTWRHIEVKNSKIDKFLHVFARILNISSSLQKEEKEIVIADTLNLNLLNNAYKFAKKKNIRIIGICTDNPNNISFTKKSYNEKLLKLGRSLDGFISLTSKLNELFNQNKKQSIIIDGVNECAEQIATPNKDNKTIFFGGSLMKKYGLYDLINAFNMLESKDIKLLVCGHHEESDLKAKIDGNPLINYLGAIDLEKVKELEKESLFSINPRPHDDSIDEYSIPSKTLESLANGVLNITVDNKLLKENYKDAIIWAKSSSKEDLFEAMTYALNISEKEKDERRKLGLEIATKRTSFESINRQINELITKVLLN